MSMAWVPESGAPAMLAQFAGRSIVAYIFAMEPGFTAILRPIEI